MRPQTLVLAREFGGRRPPRLRRKSRFPFTLHSLRYQRKSRFPFTVHSLRYLPVHPQTTSYPSTQLSTCQDPAQRQTSEPPTLCPHTRTFSTSTRPA